MRVPAILVPAVVVCSWYAALVWPPIASVADPPDAPVADADSIAARIDEVIRGYAVQGRFQGSALVALDSEIVYRKGFGLADIECGIDNTPETRHRIGSLAKAFTAVIILQLVDEGRLDLDAPITDSLPAFRTDHAGRITLHHLLSHTSGVGSNSPDRIDRERQRPYTPDEVVQLANASGLMHQPGSRYRYSNIGYNLLAAIIEQTEGKPFDAVLRARILDPLGMRATGLLSNDPNPQDRSLIYDRMSWGETEEAPQIDESFAIGARGMYSTVDDLYRWNRAVAGDELLSTESRARMLLHGSGNTRYGWGIGTYTDGDGAVGTLVYGYSGALSAATLTFRLVEDRHLIVLSGNIPQMPLTEIATNITRVLVGVPVNPVAPPLKPLYEVLVGQGVDAAVERFAGKPDLPPEMAINQLGYQLMNRGRLDAAIRVFQFNVKAYPEAWNTYDSLAEGYMEAGDYLTAVKFYNLSLDLNPGNRNGTMMLQRLETWPGPF